MNAENVTMSDTITLYRIKGRPLVFERGYHEIGTDSRAYVHKAKNGNRTFYLKIRHWQVEITGTGKMHTMKPERALELLRPDYLILPNGDEYKFKGGGERG